MIPYCKKKKKGFLHDFSFQNNSFNYNGKKFSGNLINYDQLTTITKKKKFNDVTYLVR